MDYDSKREYDDYRDYSNAVLRKQEFEPGDSLKGYEASETERQEHKAPVETMRLKSRLGALSIGINREGQKMMTITSDAPGPLYQSRSTINRERASRLREVSDEIYTDNGIVETSAIFYQAEISQSPRETVKVMKEAWEQQENGLIWELMPFLFVRKDKEDKEVLEEILRKNLMNMGLETKERIKHQIDLKKDIIDRKEQEEMRMIRYLTSALEAMKEEAERLDMKSEVSSNIWLSFPEAEMIAGDSTGEPTEGALEDNTDCDKVSNEDNIEL